MRSIMLITPWGVEKLIRQECRYALIYVYVAVYIDFYLYVDGLLIKKQ